MNSCPSLITLIIYVPSAGLLIRQIEDGTNTAFRQGRLLPWCYTVHGGNPHCHQFIKVPAACNRDVATAIQNYAAQIIAGCHYALQEKNPPHTMGQSSWSIIFQSNPLGSRENVSSVLY